MKSARERAAGAALRAGVDLSVRDAEDAQWLRAQVRRAQGLTKRLHPPRARPEGFFRRMYEERKDGASLDLLRLRHSCSQDTIRKALAMFGGDPLPKRGSKPKGVTVAVPLSPAEPVCERRTFAPYTAAAIGITWIEPVKWHEKCRHGRVEQFCTDCKRSRA